MSRPFNDVDLHAFADDQVSPDRRAAIAAYLATAPDDAAKVERWRKQNATVKALFASVANEPVPLWLTVGQILSTRSIRSVKPSAVDPPALPRRLRPDDARTKPFTPRTSVAGFALLAFTVGLLAAESVERVPWLLGQATAAHVSAERGFRQRAWEAHETFGLDPDRPVDMTDASPERVRDWLDTRVPFRAPIPDLKSEGWSLLGARLSPNDAGPGALLVYRNEAGDRLSFFAARLKQTGVAPAFSGVGDVGMLAWTDGPIGYAFMTPKGKDWLDRQALALKGAVEAAAESPTAAD